MSGQSPTNDNPDLNLVEDQLREGLESSRLLLHQSRVLIELSEAGVGNDDEDNRSMAG